MISISKETQEITELRLRRIIQSAKLKVYECAYTFDEFPIEQFHAFANPNALALVRDDQTWSQLIEAPNSASELFAVWRFHFPAAADNSGFVGWLATHLKKKFGTGVFVSCGHNSQDGGIFDYWGCPWALRTDIVEEIKALVAGKSPRRAQ